MGNKNINAQRRKEKIEEEVKVEIEEEVKVEIEVDTDTTKPKSKTIQKIENRFLKRNIKKSDLTQEELELLKCLSKPKDAYYCAFCPNFPLISFRLTQDKSTSKKSLELILLEHEWAQEKDCSKITNVKQAETLIKSMVNNESKHKIVFKDKDLFRALNKFDKNLIEKNELHKLMKGNEMQNTSDDLLPFESLDDFHKYLEVVKKYKNIKEKIEFYNFGDINKNKAFSLFEFLLNIGLYGFGTLYEYLNALSISDFLTFDAVEHLNCGLKMENGDMIYELFNLNLINIKNVKKLNDNNLLAFIINNGLSIYEIYNCAILLKQFNIENMEFKDHEQYLKFTNDDPPNKSRIVKYGGFKYKDIIELTQDNYLLLIDNNYQEPNLLLALIKENQEEYDYKLIENIKCHSFIKLKSNQVFLVCGTNLFLMEFDGYELNTIKSLDYSINIAYNDFLCFELLNGDIIFTIKHDIFCYFNMKTFSIQAIIETNKIYVINTFNQLNDKNYFYFCCQFVCFEFNMKGKIKKLSKNNNSIANAKMLGDYYINNYNNSMNVIIDNDKIIFAKKLPSDKNSILIIDEKEKIFANLEFIEDKCTNISFYVIRKNNK